MKSVARGVSTHGQYIETANKKVADHHTNLFLANSLLIGWAGIKQY